MLSVWQSITTANLPECLIIIVSWQPIIIFVVCFDVRATYTKLASLLTYCNHRSSNWSIVMLQSSSGTKLCLESADYDLISSPMMINGIFQKLASSSSLPCISPTLPSSSSKPAVDRTPTHSPNRDTPTTNTSSSTTDSRGLTRTATTLLDKSLTAQEIQKYDEILKMKQTASYKLWVL